MLHRNRLLGCCVLVLIVIGFVPLLDARQEKPDKPKATVDGGPKDAAAKPATIKIEKSPIKIDVTLKGVFETASMVEIALSLEAWTPLGGGGPMMVKQAVEHGAVVSKGDLLIALDLEKIDQVIRDLEADRNLAEVAIKLAEEELPVLERSTPVDLAAAERAKKLADEDLKKFVEIDRDFSERTANNNVRRTKDYLDYEKEELRQLEKMYKSKDLTEETEEIILRRQRNAVEMAEWSLKVAEKNREDLLKVDLPRRDQTFHENAGKQALSLERARASLPLTLSQKRLGLAKLRYDREKTLDRLAKLKRDREMMAVKAPIDGIVYYGKCVRGQWTTASSVASRLQRGGMLMPEEVLITIVKPQPLFVRAAVEEKDVQYLRPGLVGKVIPVTKPDVRLTAKVQSISAIPITPGIFEARIAVELGRDADAIMPGMACTAKFVAYLKEQALTAPVSAVFAEELDEDQHYVYLPGKNGTPEKHPVKVGKKTDKKVEILAGLAEGDEILPEKPADPKKGTGKAGSE